MKFGFESHGNYYQYGHKDKPFHVHYCFVNEGNLENMQDFSIVEGDGWDELGHHRPLVLELKDVNSLHNIGTSEKIEITPELLKKITICLLIMKS